MKKLNSIAWYTCSVCKKYSQDFYVYENGARTNECCDCYDAAQQGVQADLLPCGHSVDSLGGFGGCNPNGSCMECAATSR